MALDLATPLKLNELNFDAQKALLVEHSNREREIWTECGENDPNEAQSKELDQLYGRMTELDASVVEKEALYKKRDQGKQIDDRLSQPNRTVPFPVGEGFRERREQIKSVGERYVDSPEFKDWVQQNNPGKSKAVSEGGSWGKSAPVLFPELNFKALITGASDAGAGAFIRPDYAPYVDLPFRQTVLRDLITVVRTTSDVIEYPAQVSRVNNAAPTPEATSTDLTASPGTGSGMKPESSIVWEKRTANVVSIPHWIPVTRRAVMDAPQVQALIENDLKEGIEQVVENQMVNGDGTNDNFLGLEHTPGILGQSFITDIKTTARHALTQVEEVGIKRPTAFLLNPYDWTTLDLDANSFGIFYFGGPARLGTPTLWGLPVVTSPKVPRGTGYVGDFKVLWLWDREETTIRMSDAPDDFFLRNMLAILAELRAAFAVRYPAGMVQMDLHSGPNS